ncbi:hypothetical protein KIPB_015622, partial [Kipferlia bialata]|eukprot:g15622.t1
MRLHLVCLAALLAGALCLYDGLSGAELRDAIKTDYYSHTVLGYDTARRDMYGYIDNQDGVLYGIYT